VHDGIGALPDGIELCPLAPVPAAAGHGGGTVEQRRRPCGGIVRILRRIAEPPGGRWWPPEGGSASLEARGDGVHDEIWALPDGIGLCPLAAVPAAAGHGGGTVEQRRRPCGGIVRILRRIAESPGGRREAVGGLRRVARPLWRPGAAGCTTE